jgi:hypothetical protein
LYQFEIANANGVLIGLAQSETAYYQPDPRANEPFAIQPDWYDPDFSECEGDSNLVFIYLFFFMCILFLIRISV